MKNIIKHSNVTALTVALFLTLSQAVVAQTESANVEIRPLFLSHEMMTVRIEAPLTTLMRKRPEDEYLDGSFSYTDSAGQEVKLDLKLRTRGRFRRQKSTCNFTPIRPNFGKQQVACTEFAGQDQLKLVTHCHTWTKRFDQLVFREYLAYRILQSLTTKIFGSRLLQNTHFTSHKDVPPSSTS